MRRPIRIWCPRIRKIYVVHPEIAIPKGRVGGHVEARRAGAGQTGVQRGRDDHHARVDIVHALAGAVDIGGGPGDGDAVLGRIGGGGGLAEQGDRAGASDVELFLVGAGEDEDGLGGGVVGEGVDGGLDGGVVGAGVVGGDDGGVWGAVRGCRLAGNAREGGSGLQHGGVNWYRVPEQGEEGEKEMEHIGWTFSS